MGNLCCCDERQKFPSGCKHNNCCTLQKATCLHTHRPNMSCETRATSFMTKMAMEKNCQSKVIVITLYTSYVVLGLIKKEKLKTQNLVGNWTHNLHNSSVTALLLGYQTIESKVVGSYVSICIQVLLVPTLQYNLTSLLLKPLNHSHSLNQSLIHSLIMYTTNTLLHLYNYANYICWSINAEQLIGITYIRNLNRPMRRNNQQH